MSVNRTQLNGEKTSLAILIHSSVLGLWRGLIGLPFEHPFDCVKTNMQAYQKNFIQTFNHIYKLSGLKGFYSGFTVNAMRVASKQIYRWPLQIGLLGFFNTMFGQKLSRGSSGILCGISMALIQVGIICPFQRIKVWLMTANKKQRGIRQFFSTFTTKRLFDGFMPVLWKQMVSWVTFLGATQYLKEFAYWYTNKDRLKEDLTLAQFTYISIGVALINTLFVMPIDCVKTHYQRFESGQKSLSFLNLTKNIYREYGLRGLFKGWEAKLAQYNINSLFTVMIFQSLLKEYQSLASKKVITQ